MIRFEEITNQNIWKVCALKPFEEQKDFVAENIQSLVRPTRPGMKAITPCPWRFITTTP